MAWDDMDFWSADPWVRFNAHQAAKGRAPLPDPDLLRKQQRENGCCGDPADCDCDDGKDAA